MNTSLWPPSSFRRAPSDTHSSSATYSSAPVALATATVNIGVSSCRYLATGVPCLVKQEGTSRLRSHGASKSFGYISPMVWLIELTKDKMSVRMQGQQRHVSRKFASAIAAAGLMVVVLTTIAAPAGAVTSAKARFVMKPAAKGQMSTVPRIPTPKATVGGAASSELGSVSCTSATYCVGVGGSQLLVEQKIGSIWSIKSSTTTAGALSAVSCSTSSNYCVAVGNNSGSGGQQQTLVEAWNGSTWSVMPSPNPSYSDSLDAVSCTSSTNCVAVGSYTNTSGPSQTLVEAWNGSSWHVVPSPSPTTDDSLGSVSCTSSTNCMAVGSSYPASSRYQTALVEAWNGSSWRIVPSPNPSYSYSLNAVSCIAYASCLAVGYYANTSGPSQTFVEAWNGSAWHVVPSPNPTTNDSLNAVSCTSSTYCMAVGSSTNTLGPSQTLVEAWNGSTWHVVPSPSPTVLNAYSGSSYFGGISCTSSTACVSVGGYDGYFNTLPFDVPQALVAVWNGSNWSVVDSVIEMAATPSGKGYWLTDSVGDVSSHGVAVNYGSIGGQQLNAPIVGMAATPDGQGYWLVASDGGVFTYGDASFHGSMGGGHLNQPVVGMAPTSDGKGYWLVASDGGVFSYGDAPFSGSMGATPLNAPVDGMAADPATGGYWLVASDGGIFSFNALFCGAD